MRIQTGGIFLILLLFAINGAAQVQVTLPDTTADWGGKITVPVRVTDVSPNEIYSYEFIVNYDSLILKPYQVDHQNTIAADWSAPVFNDSTNGKLIVGGYGATKLTGKGRLVNISFDVIGNPGDVSNLNFTYFTFNNGSPTVSTVNGRVEITTNLVAVTITTDVLNGTEITIDGETHTAPYSTYWEIGSQYQISAPSPQTFNNKRYIFQSWSDQGAQLHSVSVAQPTTFTAMYGTQYYLSVQSTYGNPQGSGWYNAGTTADFSIESSVIDGTNMKYVFTSWSGTGAGSYSGTTREANVVMNNPVIETANWSTQYYVDVVSPHGSPYGTGWYQPGTVVNFGVDSTVINRPDAHYQFLSWIGTGNGSYAGTNSRSTITVSNPVTEQANWDAEYLVITGSEPEGILMVPGTGWYNQDQQFTTIKAPDSLTINQVSYAFKGWKVNDKIIQGNPLTTAINEPKTIIADYSSDITVVVTTNIGQGTKVIIDGQEKDAPYNAEWVAGSKHSIGVVAVQNGKPGTKYIFQKWSHGGNQTQDVAPATNITYIAELESQFYLEVEDSPTGVVNPAGSGWYSAMKIVNLDSLTQNELNGQTSYRFVKWQVDGIDSIKKSVSILMDKPHNAIAVYQSGFYVKGDITFVGADVVPVMLNVSGTENFSVQSDKNGSYLIAGLLSGDYVVTLSHPNFRFEPTNRSYRISKNEENQYYFAFPNPNAVTGDELESTPNNYKLTQNYPNPFANQTVIEYGLKKEACVKLTVYNVLGQVVRQLVDLQQAAGHYRIQWDRMDFQGTQVPSGVYFYRIEAEDFVQIKKMIVL